MCFLHNADQDLGHGSKKIFGELGSGTNQLKIKKSLLRGLFIAKYFVFISFCLDS